jgi:hypothetical protein
MQMWFEVYLDDVYLDDCQDGVDVVSVNLGDKIAKELTSCDAHFLKVRLAELRYFLGKSVKKGLDRCPWLSETWIGGLIHDESVLSENEDLMELVQELEENDDYQIAISCDVKEFYEFLDPILQCEHLVRLGYLPLPSDTVTDLLSRFDQLQN